MPTKIVSPEEWFALTGEPGSFVIETSPAKRRAKAPTWGRTTPWHCELVMMPDFWQTAQEPDDE